MRGKRRLCLPLVITMVLAALPAIRASPDNAGTIALFPSSVSWTVGSEPSPKEFELEVRITNVTNIVALCFSLHWDPTILNLTSIVSDSPKADYCLYNPPPGGGTFFMYFDINRTAGDLHEAAYTQLAAYSPYSFTDPSWGLAAKLTFEFVGTHPSIGSPIDTDINFTNYDTGNIMLTYWAEKLADPMPVPENFTVMSSCHFHYEATPLVVSVEGENATIVGNVTITNAVATKNTLHFDASGPSGSTGWINVTFPTINTTNIEVFINEVKLTPPPFPVITTNGTHYFIYFEFTLSTHTITIQFAPTPVGGIYIPVNKLELLAPYIGLTLLLAVAVMTVVYVKKRKRNSEIGS